MSTRHVVAERLDQIRGCPRWSLKPKIVISINRKLRENSIKTQIGAFSVLKELVVVLPYCLADHIGSLIPGIEKVMCAISAPVLSAVIERYYKVTLQLRL